MTERLREIFNILGDLTGKPEADVKAALRQAMPLLLDLTATETEDFLSHVKGQTKIPVAWLRALRKEIEAGQKATRKKGKVETAEPEFSASLPGLVDIVATDDGPAFLVLGTDGPTMAPTWEVGGQIYQPPPADKLPWTLPRAAEVLHYIREAEPPERLWADLVNYFQGVSEMPSPAYYLLQAAWVFHTYLPEPANYSPEICLYAVPERGKTRTGKAMIYVARRGVHVESLRDAYLVRLAHNCQAAIFFDCLDLWRKAEKAGCEDIILGRFERGITVPRVLYPDRGPHRDTVFYTVFGPTIIATVA